MTTSVKHALQQNLPVRSDILFDRLSTLLWAMTTIADLTLDLDGLECYEILLGILPPAIAGDITEIVFTPDMAESIGHANPGIETTSAPQRGSES